MQNQNDLFTLVPELSIKDVTGHQLYRVRANKDFSYITGVEDEHDERIFSYKTVHEGEYGGFCNKESEVECWIPYGCYIINSKINISKITTKYPIGF